MNQPNYIPVTTALLTQTTANLAEEIWREHFPPIIGDKQVNYMLKTLQNKEAMQQQIRDGMRYYLIQEGDRYIGYLAVLPEPERAQLFLSKLYLLKEVRGRGWARQALTFIDSIAREMDLTRIYLTCNKNNTQTLDVYAHLGFQTIDTVTKDIGDGFVMDDYILERSVAPTHKEP